jgi:ATP-dependent Clp protease ATP-binding subunit ClpC
MFERFTEKAIKVIMLAQEEARRLGHNFVGTEQILLGLIGEGSGVGPKILKSMGIKLKEARIEVEKIIGRGSGFVAVEIPFTPRAKRCLELSLEEARQLGHNYIGTEHLLLGLIVEGEGVAARVLEEMQVDLSRLRTEIIRALGEASSKNVSMPRGKFPTLDEFGINLTQKAVEGKLDPVVGRANEIERVIQILARRRKNNPVLIGEPGVGKTAIAEGLAQRIVNRDVPDLLESKLVIALDIGMLIAGTKYRGEFEERLKRIMDEIRASDEVIPVIDEVHTLIGAGAAEGAVDAANILKPALSRGELQCIGATTIEEYRKYIEKDAALERRFQPVMVNEPSIDETIEILYGLRDRYERHHKLIISDEAVTAAAKLADQYIADRFLPDKAIDLIDEAGSKVRLSAFRVPEIARTLEAEKREVLKSKDGAIRNQDFELAGKLRMRELEINAQMQAVIWSAKGSEKSKNKKVDTPIVTEEDIAQIVSSWTSVPVNKLTRSESDKLLNMEETLHGRLIGQDEAVVAVSKAIRRARVGLKNPKRPIASFIFAGPTGVGKTELTKALSAYFFGSEEAMVRLDMSEYMERHTVSKLIGSPPGYVGYNEGGQLTEAVRRRPYSVVLFDEIEKAHQDVFNLLLQIFEDGRLTDAQGRTIDFKSTLLILTSNIGSKIIEKGSGKSLGFSIADDESDFEYDRVHKLVHEELKQYFRPEFLNRLDEIIVFRQLTKDEVAEIAELMLVDVFGRVSETGIRLEVTDRFKKHLVNEGYNPTYGARPLRRAVMRLLEDNLAEELLSERITKGDIVIIDVDPNKNNNVVVFVDKPEQPKVEASADISA